MNSLREKENNKEVKKERFKWRGKKGMRKRNKIWGGENLGQETKEKEDREKREKEKRV